MNKYLVCVRRGNGSKNLMEIIYSPHMSSPYIKKAEYTVLAEADGRNEAFITVKNIIENFLTENPGYDFSNFKEWSLR